MPSPTRLPPYIGPGSPYPLPLKKGLTLRMLEWLEENPGAWRVGSRSYSPRARDTAAWVWLKNLCYRCWA